MKRFMVIAGATGILWSASAHAESASDPTQAPDAAVRDALASQATLPSDSTGKDKDKVSSSDKGKDKDKDRMSSSDKDKDKDKMSSSDKGKDKDKDKDRMSSSAGHADSAKHAGDKAAHEMARMAHDRAMSHASSDATASHVEAANRAAMHWGDSRGQATTDAHDAAGQMRTRIEHGDTRGMEGQGGEGGTGGGEGGMPGSGTGTGTFSGRSLRK